MVNELRRLRKILILNKNILDNSDIEHIEASKYFSLYSNLYAFSGQVFLLLPIQHFIIQTQMNTNTLFLMDEIFTSSFLQVASAFQNCLVLQTLVFYYGFVWGLNFEVLLFQIFLR